MRLVNLNTQKISMCKYGCIQQVHGNNKRKYPNEIIMSYFTFQISLTDSMTIQGVADPLD